jgi:hypothetical protein
MATKEVFVCDVPDCGRTFDSAMALIGHQGYHAKVGNYPCEICSMEDGIEVFFKLPQGLGAHLRAKHGIAGSSIEVKEQVAKAKREASNLAEVHGATFVAPQRAVAPPSLVDSVPDSPAPSANGSGGTSSEVSAVIKDAFAPLVARYKGNQARQNELLAEMEHVNTEQSELWVVLQHVTEGMEETLLPPLTAGVQVDFQKAISDTLVNRFEEWLALRKQSFTATDVVRGIGISNSTAGSLIREQRDAGKLRLVGKRGRALTYASEVGAR